MNARSILWLDKRKLINATDPAVGKHQSARFEYIFIAIFEAGNSEASLGCANACR
jgi:hypothetical protein